MLATVNENGQITLPSKLRNQMGIAPGARLDLQLNADGSLQVRLMARGASSLFGLLAKSGERARSLEEMDAAVSQVVRKRAKRAL